MSTQSYISRGTGVCLSRWLRFVVLPTSSAACSRASPRVRTNFSTSEGNVMKSRSGILCVLLGALALSACGGGANIEFEDQLKADLAGSQAEVTRLTQELTDALETARQATEDATAASRAATAAEMRATAAEQRADDAEAARDEDVARYRQEAEDARAAATAAEQRATAAQAQADAARQQAQQAQQQQQQAQQDAEEARQQAQSAEAIQRARNLLTAFGDTPATAPTGTSPVTMSVPSRNTLRFEQGDRSVSSISTPSLSGERGARLTRTRGGTDTTVVYTDRELTRALLDHYADAKSSADAKQLDGSTTGDSLAEVPVANLIGTANATSWKINHGFQTQMTTNNDDTNSPVAPVVTDKMAASFSGSLHGIPGRFVCGDGSAECEMTLADTYTASDPQPTNIGARTRYDLTGVALTVPTTQTLYFRPNSATATISLGPAGIGSPGITAGDREYMTFGWWGHEPVSLNGTYTFGVFSVVTAPTPIAVGGFPTGVTGTAEYDGIAVGLYVDQDATTARQGEFTAEVRLTAVFDGTASLSGVIDSFNTTPRGASAAPALSDSWVVELKTDGADVGDAPDARIRRTGSTSTGVWSHQFVPVRTATGATVAGADMSGTKPPAVTGTFDTEITNLLRIVGAYGAELQD